MDDTKNTNKTENLAKRLCAYYGIRICSSLTPSGVMKLRLFDGEFLGYFYSYDEILFGSDSKFGLNDSPDRRWMLPKLLNPPFGFSSLDELELKLAIRGF